MYTLFYRSAPHPLFTTFDAPDFQTVCTRRGRSNTPLQALTVANDEAFLEFSQGLAARVLVARACRELRRTRPQSLTCGSAAPILLALCREPSASELSTLRGYYDRQLADLNDEPDRAKSLLSPELTAATIDAATAALVLVCRAIFNTDAFHYERIVPGQDRTQSAAT